MQPRDVARSSIYEMTVFVMGYSDDDQIYSQNKNYWAESQFN